LQKFKNSKQALEKDFKKNANIDEDEIDKQLNIEDIKLQEEAKIQNSGRNKRLDEKVKGNTRPSVFKDIIK
jgi:hypothetical protein